MNDLTRQVDCHYPVPQRRHGLYDGQVILLPRGRGERRSVQEEEDLAGGGEDGARLALAVKDLATL